MCRTGSSRPHPQSVEMLMKIQRVLAQGIRGLYAGWASSGKLVVPICFVLLCLLLEACTRPSVQEPVTLTFLEEWSNKTFSDARQQELQQFTRETGIRVSLLPSPESARQKLVLWRELLGTGASGPDVHGLDVIWPGMLAEYFVDLKPYFATEVSLQFPAIAAGYTVENKLVAMRIVPTSDFCIIAPIFCDSMDIVSHPGHGMSWRLWRLEFRLASEPKVRNSFGALCGQGRLTKC